MKIRNIGNKVVGVGNKVLMPDDEYDFNDTIVNTPGFKALLNAGLLQKVEEASKAEKKEEPKVEEPKAEAEEPKAEEPKAEAEEAKEEEPAPKKKTTRKKKEE